MLTRAIQVHVPAGRIRHLHNTARHGARLLLLQDTRHHSECPGGVAMDRGCPDDSDTSVDRRHVSLTTDSKE